MPAQDDDAIDRSAQITIVPSLRGDLSVTIEMVSPDAALGAIRQAALPCDWRPNVASAGYLDGVCRKYLRSDGASARGTLALAPIVTSLRRAGATYVGVNLNDFGNPLVEAPKGWTVTTSPPKALFASLKTVTYRFWSIGATQLPAPFEIRIGTPWQSSRLALPFGLTLFAPALLAFVLRRRAERNGTTEAASVWVHWVLTGMWLYWFSSVSTTDIAAFAAQLQLDSMVVTFLIGAALFSVPPLAATASCIAILLRAPADAADRNDTRGLVRKSVAREAAVIVPFGMLLVGGGMFKHDWQVSQASLPAAYFTYRILTWCVGRWSSGTMEILSRGELFDAASALAHRAGVALGGVYLIGNRSAREANAFAAGGRVLAITRGLVEQLTRRELTAVIGHEVAHLRRKHIAARLIAFWGYILVIGPLAGNFIARAHLPPWLLSLPIIPLGYILLMALLSRQHEFSADAGAVELAGDPEGMIAALARLRRMTRTPVDWGGMQGSILSHPSMRDRVLALARRFHVAEERALALLNDPDVLAANTPPAELHFPLPEESSGAAPVFSSSSKAAFVMWAQWMDYLALAAITLAAAHFLLQVWPRIGPRRLHLLTALLLSLPIIAWLYLAFAQWSERCYLNYVRRSLSRRMGLAAAGGTFAGLLPGERMSPSEGFYLWDAGFLFLSPQCLTYHGERAAFSLARGAVTRVAIAKGPLAWDRAAGVAITCAEGSVILTTPGRGVSLRQARRLERRLVAWWRGELVENPAAVSLAPPPGRALLSARVTSLRGWRAVRVLGLRALMLSFGLTMLMPLPALRWTPAVAFVPIMAPLAYLLAVFPLFFRAKPAPDKTAEGRCPVCRLPPL